MRFLTPLVLFTALLPSVVLAQKGPAMGNAAEATLRSGELVDGHFSAEDAPLGQLIPTAADDTTSADAFRFSVGAQQRVAVFGLAKVTMYLLIADGEGNVLAADGAEGDRSECFLEWTAPAAGVYYVVANSYYGGEGAYNVGLDIIGESVVSAEPIDVESGSGLDDLRIRGAIALGETREGSFRRGDRTLESFVTAAAGDASFADAFVLEAEEPVTITVRAEATVPTYLALIDEDGVLLAGAGTDGSNLQPQLVRRLSEPGRLGIVVNSFHGDPGTYTITAEPAQPDDLEAMASDLPVDGTVAPGDTINATIVPSERLYRTYVVDVPPGAEQLTIEATSGADIDLYARFGEQILHSWSDEADHQANGSSATEVLRVNALTDPPLRAGRYYVDVVAFLPADERGSAPAREFSLSASVIQTARETQPEQLPEDHGELITARLGPELGDGQEFAARIDPNNDTVQVWPVLVPPGAQRLEVRTYNATGRLDMVMTPSGTTLPASTWDLFSVAHRAITARDNESLVVDLRSDPPLRPGLYQVAVFDLYSVDASDYEIVATIDEIPEAWPEYELDHDVEELDPEERVRASVVQLGLSVSESGALTGSGTLVSPNGLILTSFRTIGACQSTSPDGLTCDGQVHQYADGRPVTVLVGLHSETHGTATQYFQARLIEARPDLDLALLAITGDLEGRPLDRPLAFLPIAAVEPPGGGQLLTGVAYPSMTGMGGRIAQTQAGGVISEVVHVAGRPTLLNLDGDVTGAYSGGALIDGSGSLVAVPSNTRVQYAAGERRGYARPVAIMPAQWLDRVTQDGGEVR